MSLNGRLCNVKEAISTRHNDGANIGFADGHVERRVTASINSWSNINLWGPNW